MKRLCDLLRRRPGLFWIIAAAGVFLCAAGTPRLPGGETLERYTLIGTLSLTLTVTVTLAAWFFRV